MHGQRIFQTNVRARRADQDLERAALDVPQVLRDVVIGECAFAERHRDSLLFAGFEEHFFESFQLLDRTEDCAFLVGNIDLRNFRAVAAAGVFDAE